MATPMECHCIRTSELPHTSKLFAAFLDDFHRVATFYGHPPTDEGVELSAREIQYAAETRGAVVTILEEQNRSFGADESTTRSLERFASGAVAVVTGQQVGLFGGPAFSFYKALTAIELARRLTDRGTDAVPVFWLATEDHDLAEINHWDWHAPSEGGGLKRIEVPAPGAAGRRVGEILLGAPVEPAVTAAEELLKGSDRDAIIAALRESYRPEQTFGSAFGKFMARLLRGRGMIFLDPLDARLHRLALPVYRRALDECFGLGKELVARGKALEKAGFHAQVRVSEPSTLLFYSVAGERLALRPRNKGFAAGRFTFTSDELHEALEATPEAFSANVLLRPVVQDSLLPTAAYVGGAAEIAYFAQCEVVYRRILGRMPAVVPRSSFTLVEPPVAALLKKYGLDLRDVWRGRQHLRAKMQQQFLSRGLARQFDAGEKSIRTLLERLRTPVGKLDLTLLGALERAQGRMLYQFLKLRGKAGRAESQRTGILDRHERILLDALYPHHALQERTLGFPGFLSGHGLGLLDELGSRAREFHQHQILFL
jgi:bacillithiol biosynthesis cysteine-adding enzyme BshC